MKKVTIIGAGVMGKIFLNALANAKANFFVTVVGHDKSKLSLQNEDLIIIAVKPQSFNELTGELKNKIDKNTVVLSIMAGINIQKIKNGLGVKKVMRAMPNLGAKVGKSMTVWTGAAGMSKKEKKLVADVLRSIGKEMFVNSESVINKATAVSGSGPGFFYSLVESWLAAVESLGFTKEQAKILLFTTIDGANEVLKKELDPIILKNQVASKGGTTEAGLEVMQKSKLKGIFQKVLQAAHNRAGELAK